MPEFCVTGGTGFIAAHIIKALLERGHVVRTTVREPDNMDKVGFLWEMDGAKERLKLVRAELLEEGSFDKGIDGVDGVFHTASPVLVPYDQNIEESMINPSIKGTINVLKSCSKATSLGRVVLTSSCSSVRYRDDVHQISPLNESHWSDPQYCKNHNLWYAYAKTLAEQEAWKAAKEWKIDLVVVNPSFVVGPLLGPQPTSTLLMVLGILTGINGGVYPNTRIGFSHIDDVVTTHMLAMEKGEASGRLICSGPVAHWSEIVAMLKPKYPSLNIANKCGEQIGDDKPHNMDTTKIRNLGQPTFKTIEQMFDDCLKSFQDKGFLPRF
ncbi:tetraketide alpha-pyrone reductase 2 isoform X1 [Amborella trichopoda]|uniref:tetraketide alpha-pyrone reductase 2 isoform X1 n=2 Tax=Amborella trichopoda TaxID=13333 RepID=UPI0005D2F56D|nr:tetraketide alpha-pyrone reductase 2 isoform X1 [Amborella trichopoda]|eukprot:XP_011623763.1 tetraketide alpha-pyrone reductase 2 isoform X1 [Amborella trichopoda]